MGWRPTLTARTFRLYRTPWAAGGRPGVTVVDDGTLPGHRGSLNVDDEGTPKPNAPC